MKLLHFPPFPPKDVDSLFKSRFPGLRFPLLLSPSRHICQWSMTISSALTVAGAASDLHRFPYYLKITSAILSTFKQLFSFIFTYFRMFRKIFLFFPYLFYFNKNNRIIARKILFFRKM